VTCIPEGGAEGNRTPAWLLCRQPPFHLATAPCSDTACRVVDPGRLELPISSLQARRFPSKPQAHIACWVRGAGSNRRSPGSQSGALPLSYREHMPDPCQGFEPRLTDSESAVLPVGRTRNVTESAPGEIRTPDLPGRSRPLYPLNYGRRFGLRERDSNPRPGGYGPPAHAAELPRTGWCRRRDSNSHGPRGPTGSRPAASTIAPLRQRCRRGDSNSHWRVPPRSERGPSTNCGTPACVDMEWQEGFEPSTSCMARRCSGRLSYYHMERKAGLEPTSHPWKGHALPLRYFRMVAAGGGGSRPYPLPAPPTPVVSLFRGDIRLLRCLFS
jgi:hypothetical protein